MRTEFTIAAFTRSHGKAPRGNGLWKFVRVSNRYALGDTFAPIYSAPYGSLTDAKAWMRARVASTFVGGATPGIYAVMP